MIVDRDAKFASQLRTMVANAGFDVTAHTDFSAARQQLLSAPPRFVVTNVRLGDFNGIHLVYIARRVSETFRALVYADRHDDVLAREAQRAGAFYERQQFIPVVLDRFLKAVLPSSDRRNAALTERRTSFRGGRRATDTDALQTMNVV